MVEIGEAIKGIVGVIDQEIRLGCSSGGLSMAKEGVDVEVAGASQANC